MFNRLKRADFYRNVPVDLTEPSAPGAIFSIIAVLIMILLFLGEIRSYLSPPSRTDMFVASDEGSAHLKINLNMTFHTLPCFALSLDIVDVLGHHEANVGDTLHKTRVRVDHDRTVLTPFAQGGGDELFRSMLGEGCRIHGHIKVHKVPGNFHVSCHTLQDVVAKHLSGVINVQHTIHHLYFGEQELHLSEVHDYEGEIHPLNGEEHRDNRPTDYIYYVDIVPTVYTYRTDRLGGGPERGYQYTSHQHMFPTTQGPAAAAFQFQMSPITVSYSYDRASFTHVVTYMCAIIGGIFTVAGLLSRSLHTTIRHWQRRVRGKDQ